MTTTTVERNEAAAATGPGGGRPLPGRVRSGPGGRAAGLRRQFLGFVALGLTMTAAYLVLHAALADSVGGQLANVLAMAVTTVAGTALNKVVSFPEARTSGPLGDQVRGLLAFAGGAAVSGWGLAALDAAAVPDGSVPYYAVMLALLGAAGLLRFLLLRAWVFAARPAGALSAA